MVVSDQDEGKRSSYITNDGSSLCFESGSSNPVLHKYTVSALLDTLVLKITLRRQTICLISYSRSTCSSL